MRGIETDKWTKSSKRKRFNRRYIIISLFLSLESLPEMSRFYLSCRSELNLQEGAAGCYVTRSKKKK